MYRPRIARDFNLKRQKLAWVIGGFVALSGVALAIARLYTAGLLPGITRAFVLELADELALPAREARVTPDDVLAADEAFITSTLKELAPIRRVDEHAIRTCPGPVTQRLLAAFRAFAQR